MTKDQILNEINSSVYYCVNAHEAVYRGKVFAVKNGYIKFNRNQKFKKCTVGIYRYLNEPREVLEFIPIK